MHKKIWRKSELKFSRSLHLEPKWFGHHWHQVVASHFFQAPRHPNGVFYLFLIILRIGLNKYHTPILPPTQLLKGESNLGLLDMYCNAPMPYVCSTLHKYIRMHIRLMYVLHYISVTACTRAYMYTHIDTCRFLDRRRDE